VAEIHIDFETFSRKELKTYGAWLYSRDPSTEVLCLAWAIGDGEIKICHPAHGSLPAFNWPPTELLLAIKDRGNTVHAHNAFFERSIWKNVCVERYGWIEILPEQWRCTLSVCAYLSLPRSLEKAAKFLGLDDNKDMTGSKAMMRLAKPKTDGFRHEDISDFKAMLSYCKLDVKIERAIEQKLGMLPEYEQRIWCVDQIINERGIKFDRRLATLALRTADSAKAQANIDLFELTGGKVASTNGRKDFHDWSKTQGYDMTKVSLASGGIAALLIDESIPQIIRESVEIKTSVAASSVAKYKAMITYMDTDDRVRDGLRYFGAATGRWAGKNVQVQNFPRGYGPEMSEIVDALNKDGMHWAEFITGDKTMNVLKKATRGAIIPELGKELIVADYSSVEARGLMWLVGEEDGMRALREACIYCLMATSVYGYEVTKKNKQERQLGKGIVLGCLAPDTKVITDSGVKDLIDVKTSDMVWDGDNWVQHGGVIFQGKKETVNLSGVEITKNHEILTENGWLETGEVLKENTNYLQSALRLARSKLPTFFTAPTEGRSSQRSNCLKNVYDILNSGPQSRFMILTDEGPLIVHNCGYQMGYSKFMQTLEAGGTVLSEDLVRRLVGDRFEEYKKRIMPDAPWLSKIGISVKQKLIPLVGAMHLVDTYRAKFPLVRAFWKDVEDAARNAIKNPDCEIKVAKVSFLFDSEKDFLYCKLPSGRCINYPNPKLKESYTLTFKATNPKGQIVKVKVVTESVSGAEHKEVERQLENRGFTIVSNEPEVWVTEKISYVSASNKGLIRTDTYGGKLCENIVQGLCRDLMAEAMVRAEGRGLNPIATVHDELICETPIGQLSVHDLEALLNEVPEWAEGFPIASEGFKCQRYHK